MPRSKPGQMSLFPFDGRQLRQAIMVESAAVLELRRAARLPVNKANRKRIERLATLKESMLEFINWNLEAMGI